MLSLPLPSPLALASEEQPRNSARAHLRRASTTIRRVVSLRFPVGVAHKRQSSLNMLSSTEKVVVDKTVTAIDDGGDGLGINFCDNSERRCSSTKAAVEQKEFATGDERKEKVKLWDDGSMSDMPITRGLGTSAVAHMQSHSHHQPRLRASPSISGLEIPEEYSSGDILDLIDQNLDSLYLANAKSFQRASSQQATFKSATKSTEKRSTPSSSFPRNLTNTPSAYETPTRQSGTVQSFASRQRNQSVRTPSLLPAPLQTTSRATPTPATPDRGSNIVLEPYSLSVSKLRQESDFTSEVPPATPHTTYGYRVLSLSNNPSPLEIKKRRKESQSLLAKPRGDLYFWDSEREAFTELVTSKSYDCTEHEYCTDCRDLEYADLENRAMPTSIPPEERQKIINGNRALRNIKNELENLAENGQISDEAYDAIMSQLPAESSLNAASTRAARAPSPAPTPVNEFQNLKLNNEAPPPTYNNPNTPSLPTRQASNPPPKPEISRAIALYRYTEPDDCTFEVGDTISVFEHMNNDWWLGKNMRTGKEGVFPVNYVQVQVNNNPPPAPYGSPAPPGIYGNEKSNNPYGGYPAQQYQQQGPPPPGPSNPYNSDVPPMQMANQPTESKPGKGGEMGKKFGKKLGNAAIFGAGATIGGNIVNSIF